MYHYHTYMLCISIIYESSNDLNYFRIHAVTIGLTKECLLKHCNSYIKELGLHDVKAEDILDIVEGYIGERYGTATEEVLGKI